MNLDSIPKTLSRKTLAELEKNSLRPRDYLILERWCTNSPVLLRKLEGQGVSAILSLLFRQIKIENEILLRPESIRMSEQGIPDFEILAINEVKTELEDLL